jgi:hypothetical protein
MEDFDDSSDDYQDSEDEVLPVIQLKSEKTTWRIGVLVWPKTVCNHHYKNRGSSLAACVNSILGLWFEKLTIKKQHIQNRLLVYLSSLTLSLTIGQASSAEGEVLDCRLAAPWLRD